MSFKNIIADILDLIPPEKMKALERELKQIVGRLRDVENERDDYLRQFKSAQLRLQDVEEENSRLHKEIRRISNQLGESLGKIAEQSEHLKSLEKECCYLRHELQGANKKLENWLVGALELPSALDLAEATPELSRVAFVGMLRRSVMEFLSAQQISPIEDAGVECDGSIHKIIDTRPTSDESLVGKVAEVVIPGYRLGDQCLRPAEVVVYTLQTD